MATPTDHFDEILCGCGHPRYTHTSTGSGCQALITIPDYRSLPVPDFDLSSPDPWSYPKDWPDKETLPKTTMVCPCESYHRPHKTPEP